MLPGQIVLSILIPTTPDRSEMFTRLHKELSRQITHCQTVHPSLGKVEVIVDDSKKFLDGGLSIGRKRGSLVQRANGKYLCFLDSDDKISPQYVESLVRLCHHDRDVITFRNFTRLESYWTLIDMSIFYPNDEASPRFTTRRKAWHICPVRSAFAKMFSFPDTNYSEDWAWFSQVLTMCTTEAKTNEILHEYHHGIHSEADKIVKNA